ncbi:unnamed protein product [Eruca vesicaria subsp. sativa]|uniref:FRIGIDA-like protein n=1 Tax=Eruca vesicaria subsp. sativa TaxID=29727 RepID=A0ABC8KP76_ERUVS|nr:unnamed protein product [Eruca vesicaria subsp. sativa]
MEEMKVENELNLFGLKKDNLAKQLDKIHSHSSDILLFSVLWSDLSDYLNSAEEKVEKRFRELKLKEAELQNQSFVLEERGKVVEAAEAVAVELEVKSDGIRVEIEAKRKELDFVRNQVEVSQEEFNVEEVRLHQLRKSVEECMEEKRSKESELNEMLETLRKTQVELGFKSEQLADMEADLERYRTAISAEMEHLGRTQTLRIKLDEGVKRETEDLSLVQDKIADCDKLLQRRTSDLVKTQEELDLKRENLGQMKADLERLRVEVSGEKDHLEMTQTHSRELDEEIERKLKDLRAVLDKTAECGKQLESVEEKLDSQQKLLDTRSSELVSKEKKLQELSLDLDLREQTVIALNNDMEETCQHMESKAKELEDIHKQIEEKSAYFESVNLLIEEHAEELSSKEKQQDEITETIRKLSLEVTFKEKTLERAEDFIHRLSEEQQSAENKLDSTRIHLERCIAELESAKIELLSVKDTHRELLQDLDIKEKELKSLQAVITERNKQVEEREKKMQHLNDSNEELTRQLKLKKEEVCSVNKAIRECSGELEAKRKHRDQVQSSVTDLTTQLKSKECDLHSVKKKIKGSLKDLQSKEEEQVRLKASLMEREQGLELKEKELDAREKRIDKKDQQLKSTEQKLAKTYKEIELKAKQLSSFCQKRTPDKHGDLVRDANVNDEKTLQLLLRGHLKKCSQLYLDVLNSLKASSDPAKLVLETIRGLYSTQQRLEETNLDPNIVRSSICLLECFIDMSPKPNTEVQGEAFTFAMECKNTTLIKAENPVEVLGFLHFLAALSVTYTFDNDQVKNLLDDAFLRKYAPSLCEVLGVTASAPANNVISLDDKPEQHPPEAPINNSSDSRSLNVQENMASSPLANEGALRDIVGSPSFSPNEVSTELPLLKDPGRFVLTSVDDALTGASERGELSLAEPIVKTLVPLLEELTRVVRSTDSELQADATKVAHRWSSMMGASGLKSQLESWAFLQFIVAYGLAKQTNQNETLHFASFVAHFKQAPKLFRSLGLTSAIPNFVKELLMKAIYIPAIRFMLYFNVKSKFSPLAFLKQEIMNLRRSANEKRRLESQAEAIRDATKMRDIMDIIEDFKLEVDLPVDLILKFMVQREIPNQNQHVVSSSISGQPTQTLPRDIPNQNQHVVSSSIPGQPTQTLPRFHMQAPHTVIHNSYIATHSSFPFLPRSLGAAPNPQVVDLETHQAGDSTAFHGQSSYQTGIKRPRVDPGGPRPVIKPCFNPPPGYGRF